MLVFCTYLQLQKKSVVTTTGFLVANRQVNASVAVFLGLFDVIIGFLDLGPLEWIAIQVVHQCHHIAYRWDDDSYARDVVHSRHGHALFSLELGYDAKQPF